METLLRFPRWLILLIVSPLLFLCSSYGSPSESPVIVPSRLVVKYGDPASFLCFLSNPCDTCLVRWEVSQGELTPANGSEARWEVDRVTNWMLNPQCYYNAEDQTQPTSLLDFTVYQPPESVSLSYLNHSGPMREGEHHLLQCDVQDVAPAEMLTVTFYRGGQAVGPPRSSDNKEKSPVSEDFTLNITASREDHGVPYWCEAKLNLGPEGPQPPPVVRSGNLTTIVYFKPHREDTAYRYNITDGDHVELHCAAVGHPAPDYTWTFPAGSPVLRSNSSTLALNYVTFVHGGRYTCVASNFMGNTTVTYDVKVKVDFLPIIAGLVALAVVVLIVVAFFVYMSHYRHHHMGHYQLRDVFHFHKSSNVAQPNGTS